MHSDGRLKDLPPADLPGLIDYWPKWEKEEYLFARAITRLVDSVLQSCAACRKGQSCKAHPGVRDADDRCELERNLRIEYCCREIECSKCKEGSTCQWHWRGAYQDHLRGLFAVVGEVHLETDCSLFPFREGYGLGKNRRYVLIGRYRIGYVNDPHEIKHYELEPDEVGREMEKMIRWLNCSEAQETSPRALKGADS